MRDVIVVGAGPAGTAAAKRCAEYGLDTLMLEKRRLPRDKVCSGMLMGPVAHMLIKQEFGDVPKEVLSQPDHLDGYGFHVPGIGSEKISSFTPLSWRRNLDYWMNQQAQAEGVELWQGARVTGVKPEGQEFSVELEGDGWSQEVKARFVIGADGAASIVRRLLFPGFEVRCMQIYEECYQQELDIDKRYLHWFFPLEISPGVFAVHHKDNTTVIDFGSRIGRLKPVIAWVKAYLAKNYHFDVRQEPVWRGGCFQTIIPGGLITHRFLPAKGNAFLVGEAAGYVLPVTSEGIGTGIQSGIWVAESISKVINSGTCPDELYLARFEPVFSTFSELLPWLKRIESEMKSRSNSLPKAYANAYADTLSMF